MNRARVGGAHAPSRDGWARSYFDELFVARYALAYPSDHAADVARSLRLLLGLRPGSSVLDVGCGNGRYSLALAADGCLVTGVDASRVLLSMAKRLAARNGLEATWILGDMRRLDFEGFEASIAISSLGFFESDADNDLAASRLVAAVKPGGRVFVRVLNGVYAAGHFRAEDTERMGRRTLTCSRQLLTRPAAIVETIRLEGPRGSRAYRRYQRLYAAWDLERLLSRAGAQVTALYADYHGSELDDEDSPDLLAVAERAPTGGLGRTRGQAAT